MAGKFFFCDVVAAVLVGRRFFLRAAGMGVRGRIFPKTRLWSPERQPLGPLGHPGPASGPSGCPFPASAPPPGRLLKIKGLTSTGRPIANNLPHLLAIPPTVRLVRLGRPVLDSFFVSNFAQQYAVKFNPFTFNKYCSANQIKSTVYINTGEVNNVFTVEIITESKNRRPTMAIETKTTKSSHVKLDLTRDSAKHVRTVQTSCRTWRYDVKKIMAVLNCPYYQGATLIALAQIEDAKAEAAATAPKAATKAA